MSRIEFVPAWKQVTPELAAELVAFWRSNKAIGDEAAAAARAQQAICVVRDESGALCGVGTAVVKVLPRLGQPLYYYRLYFAPGLRGHRHFVPFYRYTKQILQDYNAALATPESLGLLLELENAKFGKAYPHGYEPDFDATFIGYSPRGLQLRVSYFEGAKLLPPGQPASQPTLTPHPHPGAVTTGSEHHGVQQ